MLKTKKINVIINVVFIVWMTIALSININENYKKYEYSKTEEITFEQFKEGYLASDSEEEQSADEDEYTDEELEKIYNRYYLFVKKHYFIYIIVMSLIITIFKKFFLILAFIIIKYILKKNRKAKMNKSDFIKSKDYYRDIIEDTRCM